MTTRPGSRPDGGPPSPWPAGVRWVFLVGFMGAGKTSVGRALSNRLGCAFEDLDDRIAAREGRTIERIFAESGEAAFRRAESGALRELLAEAASRPRVVALGGGAYVQPENAAAIAQAGAPTVFLDGSADDLFERCRRGQQPERPLRRDREHFRSLYAARRPHYLRAAVRVETGGRDIETIAAEIASKLGLQ